MLYLNDIGRSPRTPPRKDSQIEASESKFGPDGPQQGFVNALNTPVTESRRSVKILEMPSKDVSYIDQEDEVPSEVLMTPGFTPKKKNNNRKHLKGSISKSIHVTPKLTKTSDVVSSSVLGTPRNKTKKYSFNQKIRPISLGLQLSLAQEELSSDEATETNCNDQIIPYTEDIRDDEQIATPKRRIIDDSLVNEWHGKSLNNEFSSDEELLDYENIMLNNEILDSNTNKPSKTNKEQIANPFGSAPFNLNTKTNIPTGPVVDYSTHAEYVNNKTGERIVRELTEDEKRIKPKKLSFEPVTKENDQFTEPHQPSIVDSGNQDTNVGNKFLLNNLNRFMVDSKPNNSLGFEIFKDNGN